MRQIRGMMAALSLFGMIVAGPLQAGQATTSSLANAPKQCIADAALVDGCVRAQILLRDGFPVENARLTILSNGRPLAEATTGADGRCQFSDLTGGVYQFTFLNQSKSVRLWTSSAAPPHAVTELLLVGDQTVARGQCDCEGPCDGGCGAVDGPDPFVGIFGSEPIMIGMLVAAAVAIPIAVHNSQSDDAS